TLAKVRKIMLDLKDDERAIPLKFGNQTLNYFYYGDSRVIRQLRMMPFVEIGLVAAFIFVGFIGFQNIRRSEERHIWVGMAKETAHQLGTPISSLMGWLELLSSSESSDPGKKGDSNLSYQETFDQMKTDISRLTRVANRFGQIGAKPELHETDINVLMEETVAYYRRRLPFDGKGLEISLNMGTVPAVLVNGELLTWVIENLIKNSLQAVDPQSGRVEIRTFLSKDNDFVIIEVVDNGKGIPAGVARKIFRPGFTTKKRGWGLGLTLSRRIIEEYHKGKISLVKSRPGETIFQTVLPVTGRIKAKRFGHYS
ncbi:MAG: ATP-binding protein, partial [Candidatus Zixiibacteriota bacterium]